MRIAVIGLGVLGAGVARALALDGAQVTVFERTAPGAGASGASYGWINAHRKLVRAYHELNVAAMAEHDALWEPGCPWYVRSGSLEWAGDAAGRERLAANLRRLGDYGYPLRLVSRARAAELAPDVLIPPEVSEVAWYPSEGYAPPLALLGRLWGQAREHGARLRCPVEVTAVQPTVGGASVHSAGRQAEVFDAVVLTIGRWTGQLTQAINPTVPMLGPQDPACPGLLAYTAPLAARVPCPIIAPQLNVRPDGGGRLVLAALDLNADIAVGVDGRAHASGPAGVRSERDEAVAAEVLRRLGTLVHGGQYARVQHVALGLRSLPADGHTVAGHDASGRVYILATHSGITLGPLLGRLAAQEILHERPAALLSEFRPQRFAAVPASPPLAPARHAGEQ